jgi:hypothetical protein
MFQFFLNAKRSQDSLLKLITRQAADGLLFFRLLLRSRAALSAEVLFLRSIPAVNVGVLRNRSERIAVEKSSFRQLYALTAAG